MCRWLAYSGRPLYLEDFLFKPENSLINQSLHARKGHVATNGDGFGVGWYGAREQPGLYRDYRPAWNDENLRSLAEQIQSGVFFAHVRASTGTSTSRANCHPFRHGPWLFMHNGQIGGYERIRREIENLIPRDIYRHRHGTTDSEAFFLLAIGNGLLEDAPVALARTVAQVRGVMDAEGVAEPFRMTAAFADGAGLCALRVSTDPKPPTLFYAEGGEVEVDGGEVRMRPGRGSILVMSEPLDAHDDAWREVPPGHVLETRGGVARVSALAAG